MGPLALAGLTALPGVVNTIGNLFGAHQQGQLNQKYAATEHKYNMELLKYQLDYNAPKSQMQRYIDAGLNPNLIYGQGTPGNMESAPKYPNIQAPNIQAALGNLGTQYQQARLMSAQTNMITQKTEESGVKQDLMRAQENLVKANPYMRKEYVDAMVLQLTSVAKMKEQEKSFMLGYQQSTVGTDITFRPAGMMKMEAELNALMQKVGLQEADSKIKAKILESKGFQNALQEIQVKWMKDADITPQHIYLFIQMLMSKML